MIPPDNEIIQTKWEEMTEEDIKESQERINAVYDLFLDTEIALEEFLEKGFLIEYIRWEEILFIKEALSIANSRYVIPNKNYDWRHEYYEKLSHRYNIVYSDKETN